MPNQKNRIQRGSGIYACTNCKRLTRSTGNGDNVHVLSCEQCYEMAGIENQIADEGDDNGELLKEWLALKEVVVARGGIVEDDKPWSVE